MIGEQRRQLATEVAEQAERSVLRDQWLIPLVFKVLHGKDVHVIASETFIGKSKRQYNTAWLGREIIQNFVDANPADHQTINGVHIEEVDIPPSPAMKKGGKRFVVTGDWKFAKPTALISPDSEKADDRQTAGGNGIGLKQAALRLFRDYGVPKFEVIGERWRVAYGMTDKGSLNEELSRAARDHNAEPAGEVEKDWLIAELSKDANSGKNSYIIETDNPEVIAALQKLKIVGVSKENPYLQNLDFENKHGAIRWVLPAVVGEAGETADQGTTQAEAKRGVVSRFFSTRTEAPPAVPKKPSKEKGALFINGQIMNFRREGQTAADYWQGPEFVTLRLNDIQYNMSIDRPPVQQYDLTRYIDKLISSMTDAEATGQLKKSEPIWTTQMDKSGHSSDRLGCFVVIEKLVDKFCWSGYGESLFAKHFPGKPYLAADIHRGGEDEKKLIEKGFILCPEYFSRIGMPRASSMVERPAPKKPDLTEYRPDEAVEDRRALAMEKGMDVYGEDLAYIKDSKEFFGVIMARFKALKPRFEVVGDKPNTIRAVFDIDIPANLLFHQLPRPKKGDKSQELLFFVRGAIQKGLEDKIFAQIHTEQKGYFSNYTLRKDSVTDDNMLMVRHVEHAGDRKFAFEFTVAQKYFPEAQAAITQDFKITPAPATGKAKSDKPGERKPGRTTRPFGERLREWAPMAGLVALLGGGTVGTVKYGGGLIDAAKQVMLDTGGNDGKKQKGGSGFSLSGGGGGGFTGGFGEGATPGTMKKNLEKAGSLKGIDALLDSLKQLAAQNQMEAAAGQKATPTDEYLKWKSSGDFYGSLIKNKTGYIGSASLLGLLAEYNQSDIPNAEHSSSYGGGSSGSFGGFGLGGGGGGGEGAVGVSQQLMEIANSLNPDDHPVQNFEIVTQPTHTELAQLAVLRTYFELTTGVQVSSDLFIFNGAGSTGINMGGRAIGIHRKVLKARFFEAMQTMTHEAAHNNMAAHGHNQNFVRTEEALFSRQAETLDDLAERAAKQQRITSNERVVIDLENQWEMLRTGVIAR